jgi:electron-transferring-flavoprotein dehydrogenase
MLASRHDRIASTLACARRSQRWRRMNPGLVVVAGAGDVGMRLAALRAALGDDVLALRRREADAADGVRALRADLATGEGLAKLPRRADALVFCAAPDRRDEAAYRALYLDGLRRLVDACDAPRVILVTSTAVYGQDGGEWVDEGTPPQPTAFNGRVLLEAEGVLAPMERGTALRLSGLYGPGREALLRKARAGTPGAPRWTNRIHVQDAAAALSHLLGLAHPQPVYLGNDDVPALESEVLAWMREREGLPPVPPAAGATSGRRVRNRRLRDSGWVPMHADYRSGYAGLCAGPGV